MSALKKYSAEIGSAAAITGVIVGIVGFWLTICQLQRTEETLRASNTYQVQQDAREIIDELSVDQKLIDFLNGGGIPSEKPHAFSKLWKMQNFYLSVYRQSKAGGLSDEFTNSFKADFCRFVAKPAVITAWDEMTKAGQLSDENEKMRSDWCGKS